MSPSEYANASMSLSSTAVASLEAERYEFARARHSAGRCGESQPALSLAASIVGRGRVAIEVRSAGVDNHERNGNLAPLAVDLLNHVNDEQLAEADRVAADR